MSLIEVLFCRENLARFGDEAWQRLRAANRPELRLQTVKCIIACGECSAGPIARVNGQLVTADTPEELVKEIEQLVREIS